MVIDPAMLRVLKWVGYPLFAVVCLVVFFVWTFPYERIGRMLETMVSSRPGLELRIAEVGPRLLAGITLRGVELDYATGGKPRSPPAAPGKAARAEMAPKRSLKVERLGISVNPLALLGDGIEVDFSADAFRGDIDGSYADAPETGWSVRLELDDVALREIGPLKSSFPLPIKGRLSADAILDSPAARLSQISGQVEVECDDCVIGDGKAKLKVPGNAILAMGITIPPLRLGELGGRISIEKGKASFENFSARSPDVELYIEGSVTLKDPLSLSPVSAYLRIKFSDAFIKKHAAIQALSAQLAQQKRSDGFYGWRITGMIQSLKPVPSRTGGAR